MSELEMEILRSIQSTLAEHTAALADLKDRVTALGLTVNLTGNIVSTVQQDTRMIRAALNDMERTRVSTGEIEALHDDVNRLQRDHLALAERVETLEGST